jgi:hypothetical protein
MAFQRVLDSTLFEAAWEIALEFRAVVVIETLWCAIE